MKLKEKIRGIREKVLPAKKKEKQKVSRLITALTIFFIVLVFLLVISSPVVAYEMLYQQKIYRGVAIDGLDLGGLTKEEAISLLNQQIDNINQQGIKFSYKNDNYNLSLNAVSPDNPDLAFSLISFETDKMVEQAFKIGRSKTLAENLLLQMQAILHGNQVALQYQLNEKQLKNILSQKFSSYENPAQNAGININQSRIEFTKEESGSIIDYNQAVVLLKKQLNLIANPAISLQLKPVTAEITQAEAETVKPQITKVLVAEKIVLKYEDKTWEINRDIFKSWLEVINKDNKISLVFKQDLFAAKLDELAKEINVQPVDAKIIMTEGKVSEFFPSRIGLEIDKDKTWQNANEQFLQNNKTEIELAVKVSEPKVKTEDINNLGIKEIIGTGISDFKGSHTNRIKNIENAARILNGYLVEPGKEFSLAEAIGEVDGANGFFPEYVIKGDRTIKEFGGGLCQIATTTFRAALYTGLPITERKPHSYIVTYYNPIGMDAAIYSPHPDVKFINDTGHYILIQTFIKGTELKFELWGTKDGRQVEITQPEVYNWRSPGEPKLIENPNLKPGEKKLVEAARKGADAHFYRYLTMPGQEKKEEIWRSHYVAWSAIYEIGVEAATTETPEPGTTDEQNPPAENSDQPANPEINPTATEQPSAGQTPQESTSSADQAIPSSETNVVN